uniref:Uncharacterized protein n=1 Tax=Anguilla anguilla TaxID=7936 RepID=A0A0E9Y2H8_ANGAN
MEIFWIMLQNNSTLIM